MHGSRRFLRPNTRQAPQNHRRQLRFRHLRQTLDVHLLIG
jgi:hypothetical protein